MTAYYLLGIDRLVLFSPVGLRLFDALTKRAPVGRIHARLEVQDDPVLMEASAAGMPAGGLTGVLGVLTRLSTEWRAVEIKALISASGVVSYPGLGRQAVVTGRRPRRYRARLEADYYRPGFVKTPTEEVPAHPHIEFTAYPYNHRHPLPQSVIDTIRMQEVEMLPATNYPFAPEVPVLRGKVVDFATEAKLEDALVSDTTLVDVRGGGKKRRTERVLTDGRGTFSLPLRWIARPPGNTNVVLYVDATYQGRKGTIEIRYPRDLARSQTIRIP